VAIDPGALLQRAAEVFGTNPGVMVVGLILTVLPTALLSMARNVSSRIVQEITTDEVVLMAVALLSLACIVVELVLHMVLQLGWMRMCLNAAYGQQVSLDQLVREVGAFPKALLTYVIVALATAAGLVAFVVPGFIVALGLQFAVPAQLDRRAGLSESLQLSWNIAQEHLLPLFAVALVLGVLWILLACFTCGMLGSITAPVNTLITVLLYQSLVQRHLEAQSATPWS
jgi:uncharacterized membrane protein